MQYRRSPGAAQYPGGSMPARMWCRHAIWCASLESVVEPCRSEACEANTFPGVCSGTGQPRYIDLALHTSWCVNPCLRSAGWRHATSSRYVGYGFARVPLRLRAQMPLPV